jgi:hypothetical protein
VHGAAEQQFCVLVFVTLGYRRLLLVASTDVTVLCLTKNACMHQRNTQSKRNHVIVM